MTIPLGAAEESTPISDDQLVARCRQSDMDAFGVLYTRYQQPVFRYAYYLLGHPDDADDVKQETFLRAYQSISAFRGGSSLLTWLLKICVNLCRDRNRRRERQHLSYESTLHDVPADHAIHDPSAAVERAETVRTILRALHGIPVPLREILILHEIEGLDAQEIAAVLGCTPATARMRLCRARRTLKDRVISLLD